MLDTCPVRSQITVAEPRRTTDMDNGRVDAHVGHELDVIAESQNWRFAHGVDIRRGMTLDITAGLIPQNFGQSIDCVGHGAPYSKRIDILAFIRCQRRNAIRCPRTWAQ